MIIGAFAAYGEHAVVLLCIYSTLSFFNIPNQLLSYYCAYFGNEETDLLDIVTFPTLAASGDDKHLI